MVLKIDALHGGSPDTLYKGSLIPSGFSPDGTVLIGQIPFASGAARAQQLRLDGRGAPQPLTDGGAVGEHYPVFSPDGRWIAFQRQERGIARIVAIPYPALTPMITVSPDSGVEVQWSPDGRSIYFRAGARWMRADVASASRQPFGTPRLFLRGDFADFAGRSYGVAPDGKRLLLKLGAEPSTSTSIHVVTHWLSGVRTASSTR